MTVTHSRAQRAAAEIYKILANGPDYERVPPLPETYWNACQRLLRMQEKARQRGWGAARNRVERRLLQVVADCSSHLHTLQEKLIETIRQRRLLNEQAIADDLRALSAEFDRVRIDLKHRSIAVETEPIVLQDIEFGRFRVVLNWISIPLYRAYRVIALAPHPASSKPDVTHPHVQEEALCEGDGQQAIRDALHQGRILDFFQLVRQILENYNPHNPYVRLEDWEACECHDCSDLIRDEGNRFRCASCEEDLCDACTIYCHDCGECFCADHSTRCPCCNKTYCCDCLAVCQQCHGKFCKECLDEQTCPQCRRATDEAEDAVDDFPAYDADGVETEELQTAHAAAAV